MDVKQLEGVEFKWVSPITNGETYGVVRKVYKYRNEPDVLLESTIGNVYNLKVCLIKKNNNFEKLEL